MTEGALRTGSLRAEGMRRGRWLLLGTTIIFVIAVSPAAAQEQKAARVYQFNIPAKPLPQAIAELSAVTGVQVLYTEEQAFGQKSQYVIGSYSLEQALGLMLQGTGLTSRFVRADAVTLERVLLNQQNERLRLAPTTVEGQTLKLEETLVTAEREYEQGYAVEHTSTATKTDTPLLEIPQSVQIIPRKLLDDQQITQLQDAVRNVSGVNVPHYGGSSSEVFTIRGFGVSENVYRNGFRDNWFAGSQRTATELQNLDRVEILKGPGSVLYGNMDPGGTVHFFTKQPLAQPYYNAGLTIGNYDFYRPTVDLSGPLDREGRFRYRLNGSYEHADSFRDFVTSERIFVAPVLSWSPWGEDTLLTLEGEYLNDRRPIDRGLVAIGNKPANLPLSRFLGDPDRKRGVDQGFVALRFRHEFTFGFTLNAGYRFATAKDTYDSIEAGFLEDDNRTLSLWAFKLPQRFQSHQLQADLAGKFRTGFLGHTLLMGTELLRTTLDGKGLGDFGVGTVDIFNPVYTFATPNFSLFADGEQRTYALGLFLQDQIKIFEPLTLVVGARFDLVNRRADDNIEGTTTKIEDTKVTPRIGLVYRPIEPVSIYASYSQGFQPQFGTLVFTGADSFKPEESEQYEVGVKTDFFKGRFTSTFAFFHLTKENVLTEVSGDPLRSIPVGKQRSQGIELDLTAHLLPGWDLIASYAFTDAEVTKDNTFPEGNKLNNVPEHAGSLWATYEIQQNVLRGLGFGVGVFVASSREGDLGNTFEIPGYTRADAAIFYDAELFRVGLNFKNLFDEDYFEGAQFRESILPGSPFTVLGSIEVKF